MHDRNVSPFLSKPEVTNAYHENAIVYFYEKRKERENISYIYEYVTMDG